MLYAGNLTEILTFYRVEEIQSASGYKETKEVLKFSMRAQRLRNKEYREEDNAGEVFHFSTLTFRLRLNREIDNTDIVVYNGEKYAVACIDEFKKTNEQEIKIQRINE